MKPANEVSRFGNLKPVEMPLSDGEVLRNSRTLRRELLKQGNLIQIRIAILGGSTTVQIKNALELFLLAHGLRPEFYESGYNRYYEDVLSENQDLWGFKPDVVFIHTTWRNITEFPALLETEVEVDVRVRREMSKFELVWEKLHKQMDTVVIQNNFDLPDLRPLGNLEASQSYGRVNFLLRLNAEFANYARQHSRFLIHDLLYLSTEVGLSAWQDASYWYRFHMALSPTASVTLGRNVAGMIKAVYGKSKKCLVLDLDNTLWGGVIGDDGRENLILGQDNPLGDAYMDFQRYVKGLQLRGVILAVCSKNEVHNAREGFSHPDSVLKLDDFSAFQANWDPKPENIRRIAAELNIGMDSMVFVDDNPVERALVAQELPEVAVPDIGSDVSRFAGILEQHRYFELAKLVQDDLNRANYYSSNARRTESEVAFAKYGDFLASLEMHSEIDSFRPVYIERITQLINKTNQFNLTTKRYTSAEVEAISRDPSFITLYGRLADRFGDNGLVSVLIGRVEQASVEINLWLMSCRVLKREMELAMFDALVEECQARRVRRIVGVYVPSKKNGMVARHYASLGFTPAHREGDGDRKLWHFEIPENYAPRASHIIRMAFPASAQAGGA